jgi:hypothetical protein
VSEGGGAWGVYVHPKQATVDLSILPEDPSITPFKMELAEAHVRELRDALNNALQQIRAAQS